MFIISRSAGKSNRAPVKKNRPPQLTVKAALWYDNKVCGCRFPAHGLPVRIHVCGSSVTLRPGCLTESKSEDYKIAAVFSAVPICARGGIGRHDGFRCCHLGERFLRHPRRGHSSVKAGTPVFITADQALRSASVSSPCKNQRTTK